MVTLNGVQVNNKKKNAHSFEFELVTFGQLFVKSSN